MPWIYLAAAILFETIGTTALQASQQFSRLGPSILVVVSYAAAFYLLALTLAYMPVGVVYAIWSGLGICFIAALAWLLFGQTLDGAAILGMALIIAGIVIIQLFSDSARH